MIKKRKCIKCSEDFEDAPKGNICKPCLRIRYNEYIKKKKLEGKDKKEIRQPYPYVQPYIRQRFNKIKKELSKLKRRDEWRLYFKTKLDEIEADKALMKWIFQRNDTTKDKIFSTDTEEEVVEEKEKGAIGRPPLEKTIYKSNTDVWEEIEAEFNNLSNGRR